MAKIRPEFIYLNRLRESGVTNMWGAGPYLREQFDIGRAESSKILSEWIDWVEADETNLEK